jgi:hypothetical protein
MSDQLPLASSCISDVSQYYLLNKFRTTQFSGILWQSVEFHTVLKNMFSTIQLLVNNGAALKHGRIGGVRTYGKNGEFVCRSAADSRTSCRIVEATPEMQGLQRSEEQRLQHTLLHIQRLRIRTANETDAQMRRVRNELVLIKKRTRDLDDIDIPAVRLSTVLFAEGITMSRRVQRARYGGELLRRRSRVTSGALDDDDHSCDSFRTASSAASTPGVNFTPGSLNARRLAYINT